jgi:hypothetical protein
MIKIENYKHYYINENGDIYSSYTKRNLKPTVNSKGYLRVYLSNDNKQKNLLVHRLMAKYFLGADINNTSIQINHKDSNRQNNNVNNLELVDNRNNILHSKVDEDGLIGSYDEKRKKWRVQIYYNKKTYFIGRFNTKQEATDAYIEKAKELGLEIKYLKKSKGD